MPIPASSRASSSSSSLSTPPDEGSARSSRRANRSTRSATTGAAPAADAASRHKRGNKRNDKNNEVYDDVVDNDDEQVTKEEDDDDNEDVERDEGKCEESIGIPLPPPQEASSSSTQQASGTADAPTSDAAAAVNPLMLPPHEIDLVKGQLVILQSIPYLPSSQRAVVEGYDQKTCKYRVTLVDSPTLPSHNQTHHSASASSSSAAAAGMVNSNDNGLSGGGGGGSSKAMGNQWAVFRENMRIIAPYYVPSRRPLSSYPTPVHYQAHDSNTFPKDNNMQQRQQQQHQQLSNIDSKINTGLKSGDLILASINNGYSYTLVQVLDCHKLVDNSPQQQQEQEGVPKSEVPGIKDDEHGDDGDNTALCAHNPSSTYTLTLSYSPDKEIMKVMEEEDVEAGSVLSNTLIGDTGGVEEEEEQEKEGKYKLESKGRERFRKGDKVYALSPGTKGQQFHLAIVAATDDDNNDMPSAAAGGKGDRTSTDNTNFVSVTFSKRGTGKVEKVPRSMVFHRSSIPSTRQPPCISGNSSSSRNLKRGRDSNNEDTSSLAIENIEPASKSQKISDPKHEAAAAHSPKSAATAPPPPASSIITHRVPLLEELGLYDGDEEGNDKEKCNENDDDVMAESEWKVIERSIRILNKFGIDALVSSDKREVFPISDIIINEDGQKVNGNNAHGQAKESSSLRKWIEQVSPWPHKQESKDFDILRKLSGVETHECSSFWVVTKSEEEAKKDE